MTDKRCGTCAWAEPSKLSLVRINCEYKPLPDSVAGTSKGMHIESGTECECWKKKEATNVAK